MWPRNRWMGHPPSAICRRSRPAACRQANGAAAIDAPADLLRRRACAPGTRMADRVGAVHSGVTTYGPGHPKGERVRMNDLPTYPLQSTRPFYYRWWAGPQERAPKSVAMPIRELAKKLPSPLYRLLRRVYNRWQRDRPGPALFPAILPGPLLTDCAPRLGRIPGWLNLDDMAHFQLVLATQSSAGITGDVLEIGCYHGRSAAFLALHLQLGERLHLCDAFGLAGGETYGDTPTPEGVRRNLASTVPEVEPGRISIYRSLSRNLTLPLDTVLRFAHVDGSHRREDAASDLALSASYLLPGGVIAVDDYHHPDYPGVTEAALAFLASHPEFRILADLNRAGALGRKLYLCRRVASAPKGSLPRAESAP
jgi:SAM-dependent methyltransferase